MVIYKAHIFEYFDENGIGQGISFAGRKGESKLSVQKVALKEAKSIYGTRAIVEYRGFKEVLSNPNK